MDTQMEAHEISGWLQVLSYIVLMTLLSFAGRPAALRPYMVRVLDYRP